MGKFNKFNSSIRTFRQRDGEKNLLFHLKVLGNAIIYMFICETRIIFFSKKLQFWAGEDNVII
jgi:hypothetical protein